MRDVIFKNNLMQVCFRWSCHFFGDEMFQKRKPNGFEADDKFVAFLRSRNFCMRHLRQMRHDFRQEIVSLTTTAA